MKFKSTILAGALAVAAVVSSHAQVTVKHIQTEKSPIATAVWAGDTLYVSGQLATPLTPADAAKGTPATFGDTKQQTFDILT